MRFSVTVPRCKKTLASPMLRKYRRLRRPGGLRREYKKLRSLLPGATRSHHLRKKVGVVEAAYQYICELQAALLDKFSTKGIPEDLAGVVRGKVATASDIQALALHLINNNNILASNNNNNNNNIRSSYVSTAPSPMPAFTAPSHAPVQGASSFSFQTTDSSTSQHSTVSTPEGENSTDSLFHRNLQSMEENSTDSLSHTIVSSHPGSVPTSTDSLVSLVYPNPSSKVGEPNLGLAASCRSAHISVPDSGPQSDTGTS